MGYSPFFFQSWTEFKGRWVKLWPKPVELPKGQQPAPPPTFNQISEGWKSKILTMAKGDYKEQDYFYQLDADEFCSTVIDFNARLNKLNKLLADSKSAEISLLAIAEFQAGFI